MLFFNRRAAIFAAGLALAGCASLPAERGYADTHDLIKARRDVAPSASWAEMQIAQAPSTPIGADAAVQLAFFNNPRIREEYARLGLGRAELEDARRLGNPSFGYLRLKPGDGDSSQITRSLSLGLTDLLLLPARKRFAQKDLDRLQNKVAAALLELAAEVEVAWYESVSAQQIATMRDLVAQAAESSAELAQRFFDAGNISRLQHAQEYAAAALARIDAVRANAEATRARSRLAGLMGLPSSSAWRTQSQLPAPLTETMSADELTTLALENRLDLAAAHQAVVLREDALGVTRRWRWLGSVEVGAERETEMDGSVLRGPSLALEIPLFNQGQGAVARAQAELLQAQAELDAMVLRVRNDAQLGVDELNMTRDIVERYRRELVPRREMIVSESQKEVNFMLIGVFELLLAKQQEYDAYQEYLEAVRDYWTARAELRRTVGGRLPDDGAGLEPAIGVDVMLPVDAKDMDDMDMEGMDHSAHGAMNSKPEQDHPVPASPVDPHAGHRMNSIPEATDEAAPTAHEPQGDTR